MKKAATVWTEAAKDEEKCMNKQSIRIPAPRRNPARAYRDDSPEGIKLDMLTLRALAELVVDVMEERGAIPPRPTWEQ